ncbi:MAG: hypothetical protein Q9193_003149 [Seirophora villosa]
MEPMAVENCVEPINMTEELERYTAVIAEDVALESPLNPPWGSFSTPVAIVLEATPTDRGGKWPNELPCELEKTGLTTTNALVWALDFGASTALGSNTPDKTSAIYDGLANLSVKVLAASAACVIIASGRLARQFFTDHAQELRLTAQRQLHIGGQTLDVLMRVENGRLQKLLVFTPSLPGVVRRRGNADLRCFGYAMEIAVLLGGLVGLNCRHFINAKTSDALWYLIRMAKAGEQITIRSLDGEMREWLHFQGFEQDAQILELTEASGEPLGIALHLLKVAIAHIKIRILNRMGKGGPIPTLGEARPLLQKMLEAVAELAWRGIERRQQRLRGGSAVEAAEEEDLGEDGPDHSPERGADPPPALDVKIAAGDELEEEADGQDAALQEQVGKLGGATSTSFETQGEKLLKDLAKARDAGLTFEQIRPMFPSVAAARIHRLSICAKKMRWNFDKKGLHKGFEGGASYRVWIEVTADGTPHPTPWLRDDTRPELQTFRFQKLDVSTRALRRLDVLARGIRRVVAIENCLLKVGHDTSQTEGHDPQ